MAVKTACHESRETFSRVTDFFIFLIFLLSVWHSEWKKVRSLAIYFQRGCQKSKSRVQQTLWGMMFLLRWVQFWHLIGRWTKENFQFSRKLNNRSIETAFSVSRETFRRKQFFWRSYRFYEKFWNLSEKNRISALRLKQSWQNFFVCVQEILEEIIQFCSTFFAFEHKNKLFFALKFLHECRNWILFVRSNELTKTTVFWK